MQTNASIKIDDDIWMASTKAFRVDGVGKTVLNAGNWGAGATGFEYHVFGDVIVDGGKLGIGDLTPEGFVDVEKTDNTTTTNSFFGSRIDVTQAAGVDSATGAEDDMTWGLYSRAINTGTHVDGDIRTYGGDFRADGGQTGTSNYAYGLSAYATNASRNHGISATSGANNVNPISYGGIFNGGNSHVVPPESTTGGVYGLNSTVSASYSGATVGLPRYAGVFMVSSNDWTGSSFGVYARNRSTNSTVDASKKYGLYVLSDGTFAGGAGATDAELTRNYGVQIAGVSGADVNYGLYISGISNSVNNYSIYNSSTAPSYYAGDVTIGGTVNLGGDSTSTGCTVDGVTGNLTCSGSISAGGGAGSCVGRTFVGLTALTYTPARGGYAAVNAICAANYADSSVCRVEELLESFTCALSSSPIKNTAIVPNGAPAWIVGGPPGYTANANDCIGWTSVAANSYGRVWEFNATTGGSGTMTTCNTAGLKFACCK